MKRNITLQLDVDASTPTFLNLANVVIREIERGRLSPGAALPGTRALAASLGIHRNTVDAAYQELILQGWLYTQPSRGTFVARDLPEAVRSKGSKPRRAVPSTTAAMAKATRPVLAFSDGTPDPRIAPHAEVARAFRRALTAPAFLRGAAYGDPRGSVHLRNELADYLRRDRGLAVPADDVLVTRGSQMALFLAARALLEPGDAVAVEEPGYPFAWSAVRAANARVIGVPVDAQGLCIEPLDRLATREPRLKAIFVTPHHQYPTTVTLGAGRRLALLDLARRHRLTIIEDDYDHEYRFEGRPVLPLFARAHADLDIIYVGSLSKLLAPGIRLGYAVAQPQLLRRMAQCRVAIDRQGDLPLEHAIASLIADGELRRHVRRARRIYAARRELLVDELRRHLGDTVAWDLPAGGLAVWVRIADRIDAQSWASNAAKVGLEVTPAVRFMLDPARAPEAFRLGFANLDAADLRRAVKLLARSRPKGRG
jgi:GntR family transcriptional regulator / MocR family aminotransferase